MYTLFFRPERGIIMNEKTIRVFQTHIEIEPYVLHECEKLELMLSKKDKPTHSLLPIGYYYDEGHGRLYIPRGIDSCLLEELFHVIPTYVRPTWKTVGLKDKSIKILSEPRKDLQENAIDFLLQRGDYQNTNNYTQLGLNLPTGTGKTYCMIHSLIKMRSRAMIVCHSKKVREQWISGLLNYTNIDGERILMIDSKETIQKFIDGELDPLDYDYFIMLHQTLTYYAGNTDWFELQRFMEALQVESKVIDEAHLYFENSLMIDYFSNIPMTYYLTATFGRSDPQQDNIYRLAFSRVFRFGDAIRIKPHIRVMVLLIRSEPTNIDKRNVEHSTSYGFSAANYMKYEFEEREAMMYAIRYALEKSKHMEGKRLVTSGLIQTVDEIEQKATEWFPEWNCVGIHTKNPLEDNQTLVDADFISATSRYIGTGGDIRGLRILVATEAMGSRINVEQLAGRLRPYYNKDGEQLDTVMFYIVDTAFRTCVDFYSRIYPTLKKIAKNIYIHRLF